MTDFKRESVDFAEIAAALGQSKSSIAERAAKESWPYTEQPVRGGKKRLFPLVSLPPDVAHAVRLARAKHEASIDSPSASSPEGAGQSPARAAALAAGAVPSLAAPAALSLPGAPGASAWLDARARETKRARETLMRFVAQFPGTTRAALDWLNAEQAAGRLPGHLAHAYGHAWDKPRPGATLTVSTLNKWKAVKKTRGSACPKRVGKDMSVKPWHAVAVALKQRPQGSTLAWIVEQIEKQWQPAWGERPPSYSVVRRFFTEKFSRLDQLRGRHTGSALAAHKFCQRRSSTGMEPWLEVHADGWNSHFTAPHPISGEFVTYEVWHFHDVATRYVSPPAIGLTECYEVIAKGLENCLRTGGVMAVLQTDSTRIVKNSERFKAQFDTDPLVALDQRAGITITHPRVGNSQANGICENFNKYLDRRARELATYQGQGMDSLTLKRVKKLTEKMVRAAHAGDLAERDRLRREAQRMGKGLVFGSHAEAVAWIERVCREFNDRPHSALPRVRDAKTGRLRHQTPAEALAAHRAAGWEPVMLEEEDIIDLFRPHRKVTVQRECVVPYGGNRYSHPELGDWNGQHVLVAFDIMDWRRVWVKNLQGDLLFEAEYVENVDGYRPRSYYEMALERRVAAQLKRLGKKAEAAEARLQIEHQAAVTLPQMAVPAAVEAQPAEPEKVAALPSADARPWFSNDPDMYRWLVAHRAQWDARDARWLLDYTASEDYEFLVERYRFQQAEWTPEMQARAEELVNEEAARQ